MKKFYVDGFTIRSNPSELGGGFTVTDEIGKVLRREIIEKQHFTNNEGELWAVLYLLRNGEKGIIISTDSMNVIYWIRSGKSKARPDLNDLLNEAKTLAQEKEIKVIFEPREKNWAGIINEKYKFNLLPVS